MSDPNDAMTTKAIDRVKLQRKLKDCFALGAEEISHSSIITQDRYRSSVSRTVVAAAEGLLRVDGCATGNEWSVWHHH